MTSLRQKIQSVRALILDVDGVFTDGSFYLDAHGKEIKRFHTQDGVGLKQLEKAGITLAIISGRKSEAVSHRMTELGIQQVYQGIKNKLDAYGDFLSKTQFNDSQIAYMGDDLPDLPLILRAGIGIAPANAVSEIKQQADWITAQKGGHGAIREACDFMLSVKAHEKN